MRSNIAVTCSRGSPLRSLATDSLNRISKGAISLQFGKELLIGDFGFGGTLFERL